MSRDSDDRAKGIEREFRFALQALAAEPNAQISSLSPACITCELDEDFTHFPWAVSRDPIRCGD